MLTVSTHCSILTGARCGNRVGHVRQNVSLDHVARLAVRRRREGNGNDRRTVKHRRAAIDDVARRLALACKLACGLHLAPFKRRARAASAPSFGARTGAGRAHEGMAFGCSCRFAVDSERCDMVSCFRGSVALKGQPNSLTVLQRLSSRDNGRCVVQRCPCSAWPCCQRSVAPAVAPAVAPVGWSTKKQLQTGASTNIERHGACPAGESRAEPVPTGAP